MNNLDKQILKCNQDRDVHSFSESHLDVSASGDLLSRKALFQRAGLGLIALALDAGQASAHQEGTSAQTDAPLVIPVKTQNNAPQPFFITHSVFDTAKTLQQMGIGTLARFQTINDEVCTAVYWDKDLQAIDQDSKYTPPQKLLALSHQTRSIVDAYCEKHGLGAKPRLLKQWLIAKGCCAYVASNLEYDWEILRLPNNERKARSTSEVLLAQPAGQRKAMCVGFTLLARDMARASGKDVGLKANFVGSFWRDLGQAATPVSNHAFVCFELDNGLAVPAELTTPRMKLKDFQTRCTAPREDFVMPLSPEARELFLARNFGADETAAGSTNMGDPQNLYKLCDLSLKDWKSTDTGNLAGLEKWIIQQFDSRAKWVQVPTG